MTIKESTQRVLDCMTKNMVISGPMASGKTLFLTQTAKALGEKVQSYSFHQVRNYRSHKTLKQLIRDSTELLFIDDCYGNIVPLQKAINLYFPKIKVIFLTHSQIRMDDQTTSCHSIVEFWTYIPNLC